MKKVYEKDVQLLKLAEPYQMRQLISIVYSHHRERDADLLALAAEGRMYARSINRCRCARWRATSRPLRSSALVSPPARLAGQAC